MTTKRFWLDAIERAASLAAGAGLAVYTVEPDLKKAATAAAVAAAGSLLKSMAASQRGDKESASPVK